MPSQSSPTEYDNASASASASARSYSKEDLQTIYEIISLATIVPSDYAFRCIWRAYETVLRYQNIDPAHDSKYFRVLINLGGGGSLLDKFKTFLKENGFDPSTVEHFSPPDARLVSLYNRSRFLEAKDRRDRTTSTTSNSPEDDNGDTGDYTNRSDVPRNQRKDYNSTRRQGRREARNLEQGQPVSRELGRSAHSRASLAYQSPLSQLANLNEDSSGSLDSHWSNSANTTTSEFQARQEDNAEFARRFFLSRRYFLLWHDRAVQQAEHRRRLEELAIAHDNRVLGRAALTEWLFLTKERQTEHARDIYLAGAFFSTWAHKTAAIINRSNEMRQRIMARKYFNAWRSIVLENEAKIRRFQLSCAIYRWRMALFRHRQKEEHAAQVYQLNLAKRVRALWWYRACESVAPGLHNNFLMREAFSTWHQQTSAIVHNSLVADRANKARVANRIFQHWLERTDDILDLEENAVDHRDWSVIRNHLEIWRRQAGYAPAVAHIAGRINRRVAVDFLYNWRLRCRQSLVATAVLERNTNRHALRTWVLHLRHNYLVVQQEKRILVDTLYSWVLQTRYQIFTRNVKNWILAKSALSIWRKKTRAIIRVRRANNQNAIYSLKRHILLRFFHTWRNRLAGEVVREAQAETHHGTVLCNQALQIWTRRVRYISTLQSWAEPSRKYLLMRSHFRLWRSARENAKWNKIRSAYKQLYRSRRCNLLVSIMNYWYSRTQMRQAMELSAEDFNSSHIILTAHRALAFWHKRLVHVNKLNEIQQSWNNPPLLNSALDRWLLYMEHLANMGILAEKFRDQRLISTVATLLRRWQTQVFVIRTKETAAELMSLRTEKRRAVALIRHWAENAREKEATRRFQEQLDEEEEELPDSPGKEAQIERSVHWLNRSRMQEYDEPEDTRPDSSPTPTPFPFQQSSHRSSGGTQHAPLRPTRRDEPSDNLIDLQTPFLGAKQSPSLGPLRSPARSPTRSRFGRTPRESNAPFLSSIPALQPNFRSSLFATPGRPGPSKLLQTPKDRAARAREVLFKMTPGPRSHLSQAPPPPGTAERSSAQTRTTQQSIAALPPPRTPSPHLRAATQESGVRLNLGESATPQGTPQRPIQTSSTRTPRPPAELWASLLSGAARLNATRSVRFQGLSPAGDTGLGGSLFEPRNTPANSRIGGKGKERVGP